MPLACFMIIENDGFPGDESAPPKALERLLLCSVCKTNFKPRRINQVFCSAACRKLYNVRTHKTVKVPYKEP